MVANNSHKDYECLTVNGRRYKGRTSLISLCDELISSQDEERLYIARFIKEWINDELFVRVQTSGSTGEPKKIKVQKSAMIASAKRTLQFFNLKAGDSALLCLSVKYIAGKMMLVRALVGQLNLLPIGVVSNPMLEFSGKADFAAMVPLQVSAVIDDDKTRLEHICKLIIGGGSVHEQVEQELTGLKTEVWETYGMTETVSHIALRRVGVGNKRFRLLPGIEIKKDERGCLCILPSDINVDQLATNDLVDLVGETEFRFIGRYDNIINSGGVKLMPELIEEKLKPLIKPDFAISWKQDNMLGQRLVLVIGADASLLPGEIDFSALSKYEVPKEIVFVESIPKTETGKIQRAKLRELLS